MPTQVTAERNSKRSLTVLLNSNKMKAEDFDNILEQYSNLWTGFQSLGVIFHLSMQMFKEFFCSENFVSTFSWPDVSKEWVLSQQKSCGRELDVHSVVAQHTTWAHLRAVGGVLNLPITKKLLAAAASSRQI